MSAVWDCNVISCMLYTLYRVFWVKCQTYSGNFRTSYVILYRVFWVKCQTYSGSFRTSYVILYRVFWVKCQTYSESFRTYTLYCTGCFEWSAKHILKALGHIRYIVQSVLSEVTNILEALGHHTLYYAGCFEWSAKHVREALVHHTLSCTECYEWSAKHILEALGHIRYIVQGVLIEVPNLFWKL